MRIKEMSVPTSSSNRKNIGNKDRYSNKKGNHSLAQRSKKRFVQIKADQNQRYNDYNLSKDDDDDYFASVQDFIEEKNEEKITITERTDPKDLEEDEEEDPLDAFMKNLENDTQKESHVAYKIEENIEDISVEKGVRLDIDEDVDDTFYDFVKPIANNKSVLPITDDQEECIEYDQQGNILSVRKVKKEIEPLPPIDHSIIEYDQFNKCFYKEHEDIKKLTEELVDSLRNKLEIKVSGSRPPKPVCSFAHFGFDEQLLKVIRKSEYTSPTPIQAQAIPAALSGRNILGIAVTGSGKTAAYLWPMIVHIMGQPDLRKGDGPIGLVLVPTRELALQVYSEAKKFSTPYNIAVVCSYGGGSRYEQSKDLEHGAEIVVATPGRLIDLIKMGATNLTRVTYLVLDEADRFFDMGFEAQVRSICDHVRPDRQTLLFSATFKKRIEKLSRSVIEDPVKIVQKDIGEANEDVSQHVVIVPDQGPEKLVWLLSKLDEFTKFGSMLIFVTRIVNSEELHEALQKRGIDCLLLHGEMDQSERNRVIKSFKKKEKDVMIATDVASRGLDISHIKTVVNYDVARDIDTHVHRIGRTGRAGSKGDAYTLIGQRDKEFSGHLVKNLQNSSQHVPKDLLNLAMQSQWYRKQLQQQSQRRDCKPNQQQRRYGSGYSGNHHSSDPRKEGNLLHGPNDRQRNFDRHHTTNYSTYGNRREDGPSRSGLAPRDRSCDDIQPTTSQTYQDHRARFRSTDNPCLNKSQRMHGPPPHIDDNRKRQKWN